MLTQNQKVFIVCPFGIEQKYPAFYRAFHGRIGKFVRPINDNVSVDKDFVIVDIGIKNASSWLIVERNWLSARKAA